MSLVVSELCDYVVVEADSDVSFLCIIDGRLEYKATLLKYFPLK